jgi:hypothetical protein
MADARETARAWLAVRITPVCAGGDCWPRVVQEIADAILSADGVEVEEEAMVYRPGLTARAGTFGMAATHTQVVIRLPAQPIGETT